MMFISKFNALIRNRLLWGAFAFLVVVAFVGWGTHDVGRDAEEPAVGRVDGEPVSAEEFRQAYFNAYLAVAMMTGRPPPMDARAELALKRLAWRRLVSLRQAKAMGLRVEDDEVAAAIRQQPFFHGAEGVFDPARYRNFVVSVLGGMGVSEARFENYLRQEIMMNKIRRALAATTWVAPEEARQVFHQLYDELTVGYVFLNRQNLNYLPEVTMEDARRFFDDNPDHFELPEQMRVKYLALPYADFAKPAAITDTDVEAYYEAHIEEFTERDADGWLNAVPLELVRDELFARLVREQAAEAALERASELEIMLTPDRHGQAMSFEEAAALAGMPVRKTGYFSRYDVPPELAVEDADVAAMAFRLRPTPEDYFSYPIPGRDACYILAYDERLDARLPEFEEVREVALEAARERALTDELARLADEIHASAAAALAAGQPFKQIFPDYGLEPFVTEPFSMQMGLDGVMESAGEDFYLVLHEIMRCRVGDLTGLVRVADGYALGYLADRRPANPVLLESIRSELVDYIRQRREDMVFDEWQDHLLARAEIDNLHRPDFDAGWDDDDDDEYEG